MLQIIQGIVAILGRLMLCAIFFAAAVGNKIPNFHKVAEIMAAKGMPVPKLLLVGAIVFLIAGSVSIILGYRARIGALLLIIFLILATCYFHNFWILSDPAAREMQTIQFMKNLSMMGAMVLLLVNGAGCAALDSLRRKRTHAR